MKIKSPKHLSFLVLGLSLVMLHSPLAIAKGKKAKPFQVKGVLSAISEQSVTINNRVIALSSRTRFEDFLGKKTSFAAFQLGDCVKIKLIPSLTIATAKEIELEDRCPSVGESPERHSSGGGNHNEPNDDNGHHLTPTPSVKPSPAPTVVGSDDDNDETERPGDDHGHHQRGRGGRN